MAYLGCQHYIFVIITNDYMLCNVIIPIYIICLNVRYAHPLYAAHSNHITIPVFTILLDVSDFGETSIAL